MRQKAELLLAWLSLEYLEHLVPYEAYRPGGRWGPAIELPKDGRCFRRPGDSDTCPSLSPVQPVLWRFASKGPSRVMHR